MKTLGIGFGVLSLFALLLVWGVSDQIHRVTWLGYVDFYFWVLCAPVALIWLVGVREAGTANVTLCVMVLLGTVGIPFLRGRSRTIGAVLALFLWAYFEIIVAGSVV